MWIVLCHGTDGAYIYFAGDDYEDASYHFYHCVYHPPTPDTKSVELINVTPGVYYPDGANVEHWLYVSKKED